MENSNNLADFSSLDVTLVSTPRLLIHFIGYCAVFFNEYGELKGSTANTKKIQVPKYQHGQIVQ